MSHTITKKDWDLLHESYKNSFNNQNFVMLMEKSNNVDGYYKQWVSVAIKEVMYE